MAKKQIAKSKEPEFKEHLEFGMNHNSRVAMALFASPIAASVVTIEATGLACMAMSREAFLKEFYRELVDLEWDAVMKFFGIALRHDDNSPAALLTLEKGIDMKLKELKDKTMAELVEMHNAIPGVKEVKKFKTLEAGRVAVVKASKAKAPRSKSESAATGGGVEGRPRTGVGAFAKEQILKGGSNSEVLEKVKTKFPDNATTVSCIAYYRNALVKAGLLEGGRKEKPEAKPVKGKKKSKIPSTPAAEAEAA